MTFYLFIAKKKGKQVKNTAITCQFVNMTSLTVRFILMDFIYVLHRYSSNVQSGVPRR